MQAGTVTLTDFLLARIAERKALAEAALAGNGANWTTRKVTCGATVHGTKEPGNDRDPHTTALWDDEQFMGMFTETAAFVAANDPARVLAECEAKRELAHVYLAREELSDHDEGYRMGLGLAVALAASVYSDHPDYLEVWRP